MDERREGDCRVWHQPSRNKWPVNNYYRYLVVTTSTAIYEIIDEHERDRYEFLDAVLLGFGAEFINNATHYIALMPDDLNGYNKVRCTVSHGLRMSLLNDINIEIIFTRKLYKYSTFLPPK